MRRKLASACHDLGDSEPLKEFARDVEKGLLKLPGNNEPNTNENDQPGTVELNGIVASLVHAETAECDRALYAMAARNHPYHTLAAQRVLSGPCGTLLTRTGHGWRTRSAWRFSATCSTIRRRPAPPGRSRGILWRGPSDGGSSSESVPGQLVDPATRRQEAAERKCDQVAVKIGELVIGLPFYSPLMKDADARLATMKALLDRYQGHFRLLTAAEAKSLGLTLWKPMFVPDVRPLDRAATAEDVAKGRAVFHLDGKGKPAEVKLPAVATLRQGKQGKEPPRVLVVQAEVGQDGKTTYGIIGGGDIGAASADELVGIKPIVEKKPAKAK